MKKVLKTNEEAMMRMKAMATGPTIGVDRVNKVIRGFVVAQEGVFKSEGRGEFDLKSLKMIVTLMKENKQGTKSRFSHPTLSDDGIGKFLGRAKNPRLDGDRVRADLHLSDVSFKAPAGDLGGHVLDLAEEDPDAMSSSLVLQADELLRLNDDGTLQEDSDGNPLPPIWRPLVIHAIDVVDTGDAVDGFLSADMLPDADVRNGVKLLDSAFDSQSEDYIRDHCQKWLERYLSMRFEKPKEPFVVPKAMVKKMADLLPKE